MPAPDARLNPSSKALATDLDAGDDYVRLHITPFNQGLLKTYISPSILPRAKNISFHSLQSFPEKAFGYVEMPKMEAEKVKKKLNGSILKGQKVRIEEARLAKGKGKAGAEIEKPKRSKAKEEQGVLPGVELEEGRKVKRGWAEPDTQSKKKRKKDKDERKGKESEPSKYSKKSELLFRTSLPEAADAGDKEDKKKSKSSKKSKNGKAVVHEFEKRRILPKRGADAETHEVTREYVEGKGWVDADGDVIEPEPKHKQKKAATDQDKPTTTKPNPAQTTTVEPPSKEKTTLANAERLARDQRKAEKRKKRDDRREERKTRRAAERAAKNGQDTTAPANDNTKPNPPEDSTTPNWAASSTALEALYKRRGVTEISGPLSLPSSTKSSPQKPLPPINTNPSSAASFSFGFAGGDGGDEEEGGDHVPPLTPFSREDRVSRRVRSAAPTPDTGAIGRKFSFSFMGGEDDEEGEDGGEAGNGEGEGEAGGDALGLGLEGIGNVHPERQGQVEKGESEFSKWFWEHRGETNRAWKKRRKEAMKEKRQRENRRLGRKVV